MPTENMIECSIYFGHAMMSKYGDGLLAVMFGFKTPEEAVEQAES